MTELRFDGRSALITGSSQGLGLEYAKLLAKRGAQVVLNGRTSETVEHAAREIRNGGGMAAVTVGDISTEQGRSEVLARSLQAFGRIDILINNAGVSRRKAFEEITLLDYRELLAANLESAFFMTQGLWSHMKANGYGRIVNIGSGAGIFGTRNHALYGAAKAGVFGLTRVLALDAAAAGICVNAVAPLGATRLANNIPDETLRQAFFDTLQAARCAPLVGWLTHESCTANGEVLDVGGGIIGRIFYGLTPGYINPDMTIEDVAAHTETFFNETAYTVPSDGKKRSAGVIERVRKWQLENGE